MTRWTTLLPLFLLPIAIACRAGAPAPADGDAPVPSAAQPAAAGTFQDDLAFLKAHTPVIVLASDDGRAQVAVAPGHQGRVMTSTATGLDGPSYGYIHRPVIEQGTRQPHMTVVGGEDRFWLGPEGGPYALYFAPGDPFDTEHWQTPEPIDWGAWPVTAETAREVSFSQPMTLTNYARTTFSMRVDRTIRLLGRADLAAMIGRDPGDVSAVMYESDNRVTNTGHQA